MWYSKVLGIGIFHMFRTFMLCFFALWASCRNPSLGLMTKARGYKVTSQEEDSGVTSHACRSAKSVRK
jgi:hypothetical protein